MITLAAGRRLAFAPATVGVVAVSLAALLAVILMGRTPVPASLAIPVAVVVPATVLVFARWQAGVYLFLSWLVIEDLIRKFAGNDMRVFFAKDALFLAVLAAFIAARARRPEPLPKVRFLGPLLAFGLLCVVQAFNPRSPSPLYGLLGLRLYFFYVPLLFVGYMLIRTERDLVRFLGFNLALAAVVGGLGIAQGIIGLDFLNPADLAPELHLARLVRQAPISGLLVPRPTSVFVSDGRFAWYMLVTFLLGLGALGYHAARRTASIWPAAATGVIAAAIVVSGSRGTFVYSSASALLLAAAFSAGVRGRLRIRVRRLLPVLLALGGVALAGVLFLYPEAVGARWSFYYETIAPWSAASELWWRVWGYPVANLLGAFSYPGWPLGYGTGTASLGIQYATGIFDLPAPEAAVESGYGTLILELGILGPVLWLLWSIGLLREGWKTVRRLRGSPLFPVGAAILWFVMLLLFPFTFGGMQPYQNYVFNAYLWLLTGILFRLPDLPPAARRP